MGRPSPFLLPTDASARQNTSDLDVLLQDEKVAIVGLGGTGSYVLDLVSKTRVKEIHLFDDARFLDHNAFRSPGPTGTADVVVGDLKVNYHGRRYSRMRTGIHPVADRIDSSNADILASYSTVFLCTDSATPKDRILDVCMSHDVLLIDAGISVTRMTRADSPPLTGIVRTTTFLGRQHENHRTTPAIMEMPQRGANDFSDIQMAELNALNAALAVLQWKKVRGVYEDRAHMLEGSYLIGRNHIENAVEDTVAEKDPSPSTTRRR